MQVLTDPILTLRSLILSGLCALAGPEAAAGRDNPYRLSIRSGDYKLLVPGAAAGRKRPPTGVAALVDRHARRQGLDPDLVHAVIGAESAYRADAVSPKGAIGLMQVMPATGRRFGVSDLADPDANLRAGTAYLSHLLERFDNLALALAAYNAGEGAVIRHGYRIPPYPETQAYVQDVMASYGRRPPPGRPKRSGHVDGARLETGFDLSPYRLRRD